MNTVYFETHFRRLCSEDWSTRPEKFAIISAYATTGEKWIDEENLAADRCLEAELRKQRKWIRRLIGFSPSTGHAEPSWAVEIDFDLACDIGQQFHQDAIYYVVGNTLFVSYCDERRSQYEIGFNQRLHVADD